MTNKEIKKVIEKLIRQAGQTGDGGSALAFVQAAHLLDDMNDTYEASDDDDDDDDDDDNKKQREKKQREKKQREKKQREKKQREKKLGRPSYGPGQ